MPCSKSERDRGLALLDSLGITADEIRAVADGLGANWKRDALAAIKRRRHDARKALAMKQVRGRRAGRKV
jgi:hypothetical protein